MGLTPTPVLPLPPESNAAAPRNPRRRLTGSRLHRRRLTGSHPRRRRLTGSRRQTTHLTLGGSFPAPSSHGMPSFVTNLQRAGRAGPRTGPPTTARSDRPSPRRVR